MARKRTESDWCVGRWQRVRVVWNGGAAVDRQRAMGCPCGFDGRCVERHPDRDRCLRQILDDGSQRDLRRGMLGRQQLVLACRLSKIHIEGLAPAKAPRLTVVGRRGRTPRLRQESHRFRKAVGVGLSALIVLGGRDHRQARPTGRTAGCRRGPADTAT